MIFKFKRRRCQCKKCLKTFHKPGHTGHMIGNEVIDFPVCPHCGGDFIEV